MDSTLKKARDLRRSMTDAERALWRHLRNRGLDGFKFRRQHPVPPYIADFFCEEAGLVVEVDGGQHTPEKDRARTDYLEQKGYKVIRFWNNEVLENMEGVLTAILEQLKAGKERRPSPTSLTPLRGEASLPSPKGRGKK